MPTNDAHITSDLRSRNRLRKAVLSFLHSVDVLSRVQKEKLGSHRLLSVEAKPTQSNSLSVVGLLFVIIASLSYFRSSVYLLDKQESSEFMGKGQFGQTQERQPLGCLFVGIGPQRQLTRL
jgi:hypothetical protein